MSERFRCSAASLASNEPLHATASQVRRWVLVEEPSGWGADALVQSRLPREVGLALRARAREAGARVLLVRRHGRYTVRRRTCFVALTGPRGNRVDRFVVDHPADLLDVDWAPLRDDEPLGGEPVDGPLFLVCTNGRHDLCCAEQGRPVAQTLDAVLGGAVWESSHFGGDRFAGNLVCLPHGIYYGRVTPLNAVRLARDYAAGRLHLDHYRGRSSLPFVVQAAEHYAREHTGLTGVDDVVVQHAARVGEQVTRVVLSAAGARLVVTVEGAPARVPAPLTCRATAPQRPPRYRLLALEDVA